MKSAPDILKAGAQHMDDRAALRDSPGGERSMARAVMGYDTDLTEVQGWRFMPGWRGNRAVAVWCRQRFDFRVKGGGE